MGTPLFTGTVPEHYVQLLYDYLEGHGEPAERILGEPRPQTRVLDGFPVERWAALLERAARHLDDPLLGLHLGQTIVPRHLGVLGHVVLTSDNLAAGLLRLERYQRLICDYAPMRRQDGPGYVDLVWDVDHGRPGPLVDETGITVLVQFCRRLVDAAAARAAGVDGSPLQVSFVNPPPADLQPYEDFFRCPVLFGQADTSVRVGLQTLMLPLKGADAGLMAMMEQQADRLLARLPEQSEVIGLVRKTTARLLHDGEPDIHAVAAQLCCAPRTLQRRLKRAGSSFRAELAFVRRELAQTYLRDPRLTIADVALLLGYSEHSAFSRSYKAWTGVSPQQWRARQEAVEAAMP